MTRQACASLAFVVKSIRFSRNLLFSPYRDVEELLAERGLLVDHVTVWRWVQRYAPEMERRLRSRLKPASDSWRVDETYIRIKGKWRYLYRAVDSAGATLDFLLSAKQDAAAAKRFLAKALGQKNHPAPRVINTDAHAAYPPAIAQLKSEGTLHSGCQHRPVLRREESVPSPGAHTAPPSSEERLRPDPDP